MKKKRRTYIEPKKQKGKQGRILAAVSYTHLTLPTN